MAKVEHNIPGLVDRAVTAKATLLVDRSTLAAEREKDKEAIQDLEIARTIVADKEKELEQAI